MERMKQKRKGMVLAVCLFFLADLIILAVCGFALPAQYADTFLGELREKRARLAQVGGNRIILAGGSGVAFGYDSRMIEDAFPEYHAVNFGMYAGLGSRVMMDLSEQDVRRGDIVILSFEQNTQALSGYFNAQAVWQAADGDFSMLLRLKKETIGQMAGSFYQFAQEKLKYFIKGTQPAASGVYSRDAFDEYGDICQDACSRNVMPLGYDVNVPVYYTNDVLDQDFVRYMNDYARRLEKKGARVWYRLCPVNMRSVAGGEGGQEEAYNQAALFYDILLEQLDFPVTGPPYHIVMEPEWFYDTNFHLNSSGRSVNTMRLIREIKAMLSDDSRTKEVSVSKPAMAYDKEEGIILKAGKYSGNTQIQTVTVGKEIRQIEDYAFDGCTRLKSIIMESADPSDCLVGQHLLDGSGADIYVPKEALSAYRIHYSWAVYADRIHAREGG